MNQGGVTLISRAPTGKGRASAQSGEQGSRMWMQCMSTSGVARLGRCNKIDCERPNARRPSLARAL